MGLVAVAEDRIAGEGEAAERGLDSVQPGTRGVEVELGREGDPTRVRSRLSPMNRRPGRQQRLQAGMGQLQVAGETRIGIQAPERTGEIHPTAEARESRLYPGLGRGADGGKGEFDRPHLARQRQPEAFRRRRRVLDAEFGLDRHRGIGLEADRGLERRRDVAEAPLALQPHARRRQAQAALQRQRADLAHLGAGRQEGHQIVALLGGEVVAERELRLAGEIADPSLAREPRARQRPDAEGVQPQFTLFEDSGDFDVGELGAAHGQFPGPCRDSRVEAGEWRQARERRLDRGARGGFGFPLLPLGLRLGLGLRLRIDCGR